jgi:hypothetical protein
MEYEKLMKAKKDYDNKMLKNIYPTIIEFNKKYKLLIKEDKDLLSNYKGSYYSDINKYLLNNTLDISSVIHSLRTPEINNLKKFQDITYISLSKLYDQHINKLIGDINQLNNIVIKYGVREQRKVYRGMRDVDVSSDIYKAIMKKGNTVNINTFQSTSHDINTAFDFTQFGETSLLLEIDTSECPYFYLPWNISNTGNLKTEMLMGSELELLLPRNITMEYVGKQNILNYKRYKDWLNFEKRTMKKTSKVTTKHKSNITETTKTTKTKTKSKIVGKSKVVKKVKGGGKNNDNDNDVNAGSIFMYKFKIIDSDKIKANSSILTTENTSSLESIKLNPYILKDLYIKKDVGNKPNQNTMYMY